MATRKHDFKNLTQAQLADIAASYPKAVETVHRPVYRILAMLMEAGAPIPHLTQPPVYLISAKAAQSDLVDTARVPRSEVGL